MEHLVFATRETAVKFFQFLRHPSLGYSGLMISWRVFGSLFPSNQLFAVNILYPGYGYY